MTRRPGRFVAAAIAAFTLASAGPGHAQMAVYDATTYVKVLQQAQTALNQLEQLKQQLTQAQQLYASLNNVSNIASIAPTLISVPPVLSSTLQSFANVSSGNFSSLGSAAARATQIRTSTQIYTPTTSTNAVQTFYDQALTASGNRAAAAQAVSEQAYSIADQRAQGLAQLRDAIPNAADARAVADLNARIAIESAMIANDQMRLQALQMQQQSQTAQAAQANAEEVAKTAQTRAALLQSMHP